MTIFVKFFAEHVHYDTLHMSDIGHVSHSTIQKSQHRFDIPLGDFSGRDNYTLVLCPLKVADDDFDNRSMIVF